MSNTSLTCANSDLKLPVNVGECFADYLRTETRGEVGADLIAVALVGHGLEGHFDRLRDVTAALEATGGRPDTVFQTPGAPGNLPRVRGSHCLELG